MRSISDDLAGLEWPPTDEERALAAQLRELDRSFELECEALWGAADRVDDDVEPDVVVDDAEIVAGVLDHGVDPWSLELLRSIDPASLLDAIDRVRYLQALDAVAASVGAWQQRALVAVAGATSSGDLRHERHIEHEVAVARRSTRGRAGRDIELARALHEEFRSTAALVERGVIGLEHAAALVVGTRHVSSAEARAEVERRVLPQASVSSPVRFRRHVDAAVCAVDAEDETRRRERARGDRQVWVRRIENGLGELVVVDEWSVVSAIYERISAEAHELQRERRTPSADEGGPARDEWLDRTLDNCRADALSHLVLAEDTEPAAEDDADPRHRGDPRTPRPRRRPRPRVEGRLVIDLQTLRGEADNPCLLDGSPVPAPVGRRLARDIEHWRRMVTDPVHGHLLDYGRRTYLPDSLRAFVLERDRTCRSPWCEQPAMRCEMDHATEFPDGPSDAANTGALCADCHLLKTERAARPEGSASDGSVTWRTAWGQRVPLGPTRYLDDGGHRTGRTVPGVLDRDVDLPAGRGFGPVQDLPDDLPF